MKNRFIVIDQTKTNAFKNENISARWLVFDRKRLEWVIAKSTKKEALEQCRDWNEASEQYRKRNNREPMRMFGHLSLIIGGAA